MESSRNFCFPDRFTGELMRLVDRYALCRKGVKISSSYGQILMALNRLLRSKRLLLIINNLAASLASWRTLTFVYFCWETH